MLAVVLALVLALALALALALVLVPVLALLMQLHPRAARMQRPTSSACHCPSVTAAAR
jgi:hypothetical protein